jgi:hypothetical protein
VEGYAVMKAMSLLMIFLAVLSAGEARAAAGPRVFSLRPDLLAQTKARLTAVDTLLQPALDALRHQADQALGEKPLSVMDKSKVPPSGDKHDYLSLGPYWWPDPNRPGGLPYIRRDGEVNPDNRVGVDHDALGHTCSRVYTLALAYYFTRDGRYADRAALLLKVWFLDPATKMNPNLEYAQGVPGHNTGRGTGLIDTTSLIGVADSMGLLDGSRAWTPELRDGMKAWLKAFLHWMLTSKNGKDEARAANNHGAWYRAQAAAYALACGDAGEARRQVEYGRALIARQIEPDGRQPLELARTKSYSYSLFNLKAMFTLAELGERVDVDLYHYHTKDGRSIRSALDYLSPYFTDPASWPHRQIAKVRPPDEGLAELLRQASLVFHETKYEQLLNDSRQRLAAARFQLTWPAAAATLE